MTRKWLAIPSNRQFLTHTYTVNLNCTTFKHDKFLVNIKKAKSREYYNLLISKVCENPTCLKLWDKEGLENPERVFDSLIIYRKVTKETDLLTLQYKLIHNIIATNKRKTDWKVANQSRCSYCPEIDTLIHFFWECSTTKAIIDKCFQMLKLPVFSFNKWDFLLGKDDISIDNLSLIIKSYIYKLRMHDNVFSENEFKKEFEMRILADRMYKKSHICDNKWKMFEQLNHDSNNVF